MPVIAELTVAYGRLGEIDVTFHEPPCAIPRTESADVVYNGKPLSDCISNGRIASENQSLRRELKTRAESIGPPL